MSVCVFFMVTSAFNLSDLAIALFADTRIKNAISLPEVFAFVISNW